MLLTDVRTCRVCDTEKPITEYYRRANRPPTSRARDCRLCYQKARHNDGGKIMARQERRAELALIGAGTCATCDKDFPLSALKSKGGPWCVYQCRPCAHAAHVKSRFKISADRYAEMLAEQDGHCAMCPITPEENGKRLAVDHDHACCPGKSSCGLCVRALLCANCNVGIGYLGSVELLRSALAYMEKYS